MKENVRDHDIAVFLNVDRATTAGARAKPLAQTRSEILQTIMGRTFDNFAVDSVLQVVHFCVAGVIDV